MSNQLSPRELEFITLCCSELLYKEIAVKMGVSFHTVEGYRDTVFHKLNLKSRQGIILYAVKNGLLSNNN